MGAFLDLERYVWFDQQVKSGYYPNASDLANQFELSRKTAQRTIERMRDRLFAPLEYDPVKRGYYYAQDNFTLPSLHASQEEILAILLAQQLLSHSAGGYISERITQFGKKLLAMTAYMGLGARRMAEAFSASWNSHAPAPAEAFRFVATALIVDRPLLFMYRSPATDEITLRSVEPHHLQHYMASWVLLAWCRNRREWRKFYLSRMSDIQILPEPFQRRPKDEWAPLLEDAYGIFQGGPTTEAILHFTPFRARWIREQLWHPDQQVTEHPDGSLDLTLPVADFREIKMKILQFGADVEVTAPESLRREIEAEIGKMNHLYRQRPPAK